MGRNDAKMDYDTIFDLYGINRDSLSVNEERGLRQSLTRWLKAYLKSQGYPENMRLYDLKQTEQDYFICIVIKKKLIEAFPYQLSEDKIQKKLDERLKESLVYGEQYLKERNSVIENVKKRDYVVEKATERQKEQAYQEFCDTWKYFFHTQPPAYKSFLRHPNLSVYDYMKSKEFGLDVSDRVNEVIIKIILEVLKKKLGLEIDVSAIEDCIIESCQNYYDGEFDVSFYEDEVFPETFEKYWNEQVDGDMSEYSEEEIKSIKEDYEKMRTFLVKAHGYQSALNKLGNFYTVK